MRKPEEAIESGEQQATMREWLADAQLQGQADTYVGKRCRPRVTWPVPLTVGIMDGERRGQTEYVTATDISEGCLGLRSRRSIPEWKSPLI